MNSPLPTATDPNRFTRKVRGLFLAGWDGPDLSPAVERLLTDGLRGVVLFTKNIRSPQQTASLCAAVHRTRGPGAIIGIDQEGGRVARLRDGFFVSPSMGELGRVASPELVYDLGRLVGLQLKSLGIHLNFAPVLDVDTNPDNPVIGSRSFGSDPQLVARLGVALARGLQEAGVAACAKHFPGHGDTHQDSHLTLPRLIHPRKRLDAVELPPFRNAIDHGIASVMTAHIVFESLNPSPDDPTLPLPPPLTPSLTPSLTPATMSRAVVTDLLRGEMNFRGVVVSDDLEMKAIANHMSIEDAAVGCLRAGVDLMLICHRPELVTRAAAAVTDAVRSGELAEDAVHAAHDRVERLAQQYRPAAAPQTRKADQRELLALTEKLTAAFADLGLASAPHASDPTDFKT